MKLVGNNTTYTQHVNIKCATPPNYSDIEHMHMCTTKIFPTKLMNTISNTIAKYNSMLLGCVQEISHKIRAPDARIL